MQSARSSACCLHRAGGHDPRPHCSRDKAHALCERDVAGNPTPSSHTSRVNRGIATLLSKCMRVRYRLAREAQMLPWALFPRTARIGTCRLNTDWRFSSERSFGMSAQIIKRRRGRPRTAHQPAWLSIGDSSPFQSKFKITANLVGALCASCRFYGKCEDAGSGECA
jgi:hypothetical protein